MQVLNYLNCYARTANHLRMVLATRGCSGLATKNTMFTAKAVKAVKARAPQKAMASMGAMTSMGAMPKIWTVMMHRITAARKRRKCRAFREAAAFPCQGPREFETLMNLMSIPSLEQLGHMFGQNAAAARLDVPEHVPLTVPDRNACQARNSLLTYRPLPLSHSSHSKHFGACGPGPVFAVQRCALPVLCVAGFLRWVETMR